MANRHVRQAIRSGLAGFLLLAVSMLAVAEAQATSSAGNDRPLYLDIMGTNESQAVLPDDLVEAMAREVLSQSGKAVLSVDHDNLPAGVRVLRIMVLVSEQQDATGSVITAAATTSLLATPADDGKANPTRTFYQGMQQELATGPDQQAAQDALRSQFKSALQRRVRAALSSTH